MRRLVSVARHHLELLDYFLDFRRDVYVWHRYDVEFGHAKNLREERRVIGLKSAMPL